MLFIRKACSFIFWSISTGSWCKNISNPHWQLRFKAIFWSVLPNLIDLSYSTLVRLLSLWLYFENKACFYLTLYIYMCSQHSIMNKISSSKIPDEMGQVLTSLVWFLHVNNVGLFKINHMWKEAVPEVHFSDQTFLLLTWKQEAISHEWHKI